MDTENVFVKTFPETAKNLTHYDIQVRAEARTVYAAFKAGYLIGKMEAKS